MFLIGIRLAASRSSSDQIRSDSLDLLHPLLRSPRKRVSLHYVIRQLSAQLLFSLSAQVWIESREWPNELRNDSKFRFLGSSRISANPHGVIGHLNHRVSVIAVERKLWKTEFKNNLLRLAWLQHHPLKSL
jgi:hypothetical protein